MRRTELMQDNVYISIEMSLNNLGLGSKNSVQFNIKYSFYGHERPCLVRGTYKYNLNYHKHLAALSASADTLYVSQVGQVLFGDSFPRRRSTSKMLFRRMQ